MKTFINEKVSYILYQLKDELNRNRELFNIKKSGGQSNFILNQITLDIREGETAIRLNNSILMSRALGKLRKNR